MTDSNDRKILVVEKITCDTKCEKKYVNPDGTFKGGKGKAFDNCVKAKTECCTGVTDPSGLCASIGRKAGKIQ